MEELPMTFKVIFGLSNMQKKFDCYLKNQDETFEEKLSLVSASEIKKSQNGTWDRLNYHVSNFIVETRNSNPAIFR